MSLDKFKSRLFKMDGIDNNNPMFNCIVTYTSKHGTVSDNTSARMDVDTMSHGKIHLDETDKLTSDDYHLDLSLCRHQPNKCSGQQDFQPHAVNIDIQW